MNRDRGFTLLELLISLAILGILVAFAYPSYVNYVLQSRRADAISSLAQDQIIFERCYAQNYAYDTACTAVPAFPQTSGQGYYSITVTNLGATTYTLTATPIGNQANDSTCASMTINQANVKTATDSSGNDETSTCWRSG